MQLVPELRYLRAIAANLSGYQKSDVAAGIAAPLFEIVPEMHQSIQDSTADAVASAVRCAFTNDALRLPFPTIKVYDHLLPWVKWFIISQRPDNCIRITALQENILLDGKDAVRAFTFEYRCSFAPATDAVSVVPTLEFITSNRQGKQFVNFGHDVATDVTQSDIKDIQSILDLKQWLGEFSGHLCDRLLFIIANLYAPSSFVSIQTESKNDPKGVEWQRAHSKIVMIHRQHEANNKSIAKGSCVKVNENRHLKRMAHSRRAHTRLLQSPRYKGKAGTRIWIKSTWVGPEEWNDSLGRVYRIVTR